MQIIEQPESIVVVPAIKKALKAVFIHPLTQTLEFVYVQVDENMKEIGEPEIIQADPTVQANVTIGELLGLNMNKITIEARPTGEIKEVEDITIKTIKI